MKRRLIFAAILVCALTLAGVTGSVYAQPGSYNLSWWTVDGGGGSSSASGYSLSGSAGQSDAGALSGTGYQLAGGFWAGGAGGTLLRSIYLPLVAR